MRLWPLVLLLTALPSGALASADLRALAGAAANADWEHAISAEIVIQAPVADVWNYLSANGNAADWSVYFDHISTLPGVPEGQLGSDRRCYRNHDEKGLSWDEVTIGLIPRALRILSIHGFRGLRFRAELNPPIFVKQIYQKLGPDSTRVTFQTAAGAGMTEEEEIEFLFVRGTTRETFEENLENIRAAIEDGDAYKRLHARKPFPINTIEAIFTLPD
jgi:hypothetical protein